MKDILKNRMMKIKLVLVMFLSVFYLGQAQETVKLSSESKLTIDGTSTLHDWTVTANEILGNATMEKELPKTITFEVVVDKIISEHGATMDKKTHNALKKGEHPKIVFSLTEVSNSKTLKGKLKVAGKEKTITLPVVMSGGNGSLNIKGEYAITLADYGIEPPTAMFGAIVVGDVVTVKFDLKFSKN